MRKTFTYLRGFMLVLLLLAFPMSGFRSADVTVEKNSIVKVEKETIKSEPKDLVKPVPVEEEFSDFLIVTATIYHAVPAQCDSTPTITASGAVIDTARATELRWCAISWDLHQRYGGPLKFGDVIEVKGTYGKYAMNGKYVVKDLMAPRWKNRIDILRHPKDGGHTFDSVKIKHKKFKEFQKKRARELRKKANAAKRQLIREQFQKALGKLPFVGSDVLRKENYTVSYPILTDVSLPPGNKEIIS